MSIKGSKAARGSALRPGREALALTGTPGDGEVPEPRDCWELAAG